MEISIANWMSRVCESDCNKPPKHLKVPKDAQLLGQRNLIVTPDLQKH